MIPTRSGIQLQARNVRLASLSVPGAYAQFKKSGNNFLAVPFWSATGFFVGLNAGRSFRAAEFKKDRIKAVLPVVLFLLRLRGKLSDTKYQSEKQNEFQG